MVFWYALIGFLIGWAVVWLAGVAYGRPRLRSAQAELETCRQQLDDERERAKLFQAKIEALEEEAKGLRARVQRLEGERDRYRHERDAVLAELRSLAPEVDEPGETVASGDDLKRIEGIGPKIERLLQRAGVRSFEELAATPVARLKELLAAGGRRFRLADPRTWPQQARLAAEGRWDELEAYQKMLKGGRGR
ncbi:helix-hairpin-helix domain-containing protein [Deinococcota bacterium DY0809b]